MPLGWSGREQLTEHATAQGIAWAPTLRQKLPKIPLLAAEEALTVWKSTGKMVYDTLQYGANILCYS